MTANHYLKPTVNCHQKAYLAGPDPTTLYALVSLEPQAISGRMPLDVRLVLDRSYSMTEKVGRQTKLDLLKQAMCQVVAQLESGDRIAVVTFNDRHKILVPPTLLQTPADKNAIQELIRKIGPGGGTRMSGALRAAMTEAACPDFTTRLICFTDGMVCCGDQENEQKTCMDLARSARHAIPWLIFATGVDYDDRFLGTLAELNGGRYDHIADVQEASDLFAKEIGLLGEIVLTHLMLSVETSPGFQLQQVNRVVPEIKPVAFQSLNYCVIDLGELDRVRGQKVLLQLQGSSGAAGDVTVADIAYSYNLPLRKLLNQTGRFPITATFTHDPAQIQADSGVLQTIQLTGASQLYTLGIQALHQGQIGTASRTLTTAAQLYTQLGETAMGQKIQTLTTAASQGTLGTDAEEMKRTLCTQVRYTVSRTLTNEE